MSIESRKRPGNLITPYCNFKVLSTRGRLVVLLSALLVAVVLPAALSEAGEKTALRPCPDGSNALCLDPGLMAKDGSWGNNGWQVSGSCPAGDNQV